MSLRLGKTRRRLSIAPVGSISQMPIGPEVGPGVVVVRKTTTIGRGEEPTSERESDAWSWHSGGGWQRWDGASADGWGNRSRAWSWCTERGHRGDVGRDSRAHGQATMTVTSPRSPPAPGYDRDGNPPSGEVSSVGDAPGPREPGGEDVRKNKGKVSSSYPPIFRAKPGESYRDWRRSVDFWLGGEGHQIPVEYIGPRIMVQLRDRASQLVRHLNNEDVNGADGMARIFSVLERSPIVKQLDKHRIDQHRKRLMSLTRLAGESLESYITRGSIYRNQLLGLDSSLEMGEKFYIGHLVDHARLTRRDKALVRTRAGEDTEDAVTNAMIELAAELEGEHGFPIGASEPNVAGANGEEHLIQRTERHYPGKKLFGKAALGAEVMSMTGEAEENETVFGEERSEDGIEEDLPPEIMEAEREAYALHYKAKHRMAEVKKMRKFYKPGESAEDRKKAIAERMKTTACHNCGEVGHWSRECPRAAGKAQNVYVTSGGRLRRPTASTMATVEEEPSNRDDEWRLLTSLCSQAADNHSGVPSRAYMVRPGSIGPGQQGQQDVLWCMQELRSSVILDLGCLKSVAGTQWINQIVGRWKAQGRWFKIFEEKEVFRFGNGETLTSRYGLVLHCTFAGQDVILNFSVVKGDCPPLLSRPACTQLGIIFDCSQHTLSSRKLQVKQYGLTQTSSGHYVMCIEEFSEKSDKVRLPDDFKMCNGDEAIVWSMDQNVLATQTSGSRSTRVLSTSPTHGAFGSRSPKSTTLSNMRRHRAQDQGVSEHPVGRGAASTAHGGHGHGWDQRGQLLQEGAGSSTTPSVVPQEGAAGSRQKPLRCRELSMGGRRRDAGEDSARGVPHGPGGLVKLTPKEMATIQRQREKTSRSAAKRIEQKALTGIQADYPSLNGATKSPST